MGESRREGDGRKAKMEWPPIKPKSNLSITRLKDTDIFTVQNFFTSVESKAFINAAESIGFVHQGGLGPTKGEAYRDNDRISVNDPVLADSPPAVVQGINRTVLFLIAWCLPRLWRFPAGFSCTPETNNPTQIPQLCKRLASVLDGILMKVLILEQESVPIILF
ncbi:Isopentenyl-diphosphate delta-isomerase [Actinidia chinensis var. chinensis]|uniref:Isopentenyl-diphosphate delta-isomerase n=1 Tax=Actinidia chinensis var. chinensis TaxID=1590841 RepID=A0A2R6RSY5_ACTCC|nr:Isopentenyl-diphosphate delta-isomerase [Actinidia chinensis var. chinensis]